jgi:hypothetical protein
MLGILKPFHGEGERMSCNVVLLSEIFSYCYEKTGARIHPHHRPPGRTRRKFVSTKGTL